MSFSEQRRLRVSEFLNQPLSDTEADEAFPPYLQAHRAVWRWFPDVSEYLKRTANIPKVIVSNGDREQQMQKVVVTGLTEHIVGIATPLHCGHWKPHPKIFSHDGRRACGMHHDRR